MLHKEELDDFYRSPSFVKVVKCGGHDWLGM
jgi:hypothetical protein